MGSNRIVRAALMVSAFLVGPVLAQDATTVGQLSAINSANILKAARVEGAKLDAELAQAGVSTGVSGSVSVAPAPGSGDSSPAPVVRGVFGSNGKLSATFVYADKSTVDAVQGTTIPGGYRVVSLSSSHVVLMKEGRRIEVGFSAAAPRLPTATTTGASTIPGAMPFQMVGQQ